MFIKGIVGYITWQFSSDVGKVDILVCNAGLLGQTEFTKTIDGHELTYQTNFLGSLSFKISII